MTQEQIEDLKQRYNYEIKRYRIPYLDNIGKENEEYYSLKLFDLFDAYTKKFGEIHPIEGAINHEAKVRRGEVESENEKWAQFKKDNNIKENKAMKSEKDRMTELVQMFSNKNEIFISKEENETTNESVDKECKRLQTLASGKANANFKENYMSGSDRGLGGKQGRTVNSIIDQMYDNPAVAYTAIRQPLQPEEGVELAIKRALKSGAPVNDMGFYDEVNWHLMSLGFSAKNPIDIKNGVLKMMDTE